VALCTGAIGRVQADFVPITVAGQRWPLTIFPFGPDRPGHPVPMETLLSIHDFTGPSLGCQRAHVSGFAPHR